MMSVYHLVKVYDYITITNHLIITEHDHMKVGDFTSCNFGEPDHKK